MRLIDADAFLERMSHTDRFFGVVFDINDAPTVDAVAVVHACWIDYETMSWRHESPKRRKYYRCSNCRTASAVRHKACPNCFARMDADTYEREETTKMDEITKMTPDTGKRETIKTHGECETVCHCNVKQNAELIAQILDYDVCDEVAPFVSEQCKMDMLESP